jgi:S-DNA-T family DNA segregation ATPase FtsK/SpoIIIE
VDRCEECGYEYDEVDRDAIPDALRALGMRYQAVLTDTDVRMLRAHPRAGVWSALEYCCHVRDVFRVQRERVLLALADDQPAFASMRREERVVEERYNDQSPVAVAPEIVGAAASLSRTLESLDDDGWQRTSVYNWPSKQVRTVEWIGRHTIHEGKHHLQDISRLMTAEPGG